MKVRTPRALRDTRPNRPTRRASPHQPGAQMAADHATPGTLADPAVSQHERVSSPMLAPETILQLQRTQGNQAVQRLLAAQQTVGHSQHSAGLEAAAEPTIRRLLDEDFEHGGTPGPDETSQCSTFAQQVSTYVDQAYNELISGNLAAWKGAKAATFIDMVLRGSSVAHTHAANAIEERVYALMPKGKMSGLTWVPQFAEAMGAASKPDIVIHLPSGKQALVDITSDRGHILGKAGGWTTSELYVYVAEAYFPSITKADIPNIKAALQRGGIGEDEARALKRDADEQRKDRRDKKRADTAEVRTLYNTFSSFENFAQTCDHFKHLPQSQRHTAATVFLRKHGIVVRGMRSRKGPRKPSPLTKQKMLTKARKVRAAKQKQSVEALLAVATGAGRQAPPSAGATQTDERE